MIDTSAFLGRWPFRFLPQQPLSVRQRPWKRSGMTQVWVSPLESVFLTDPMPCNEALAKTVRTSRFFIFVAGLNPSLATWRRDAEYCVARLRARALKLWPNYHDYSLHQPRVGELARWAQEHDVPLCIQLRMQDERNHPAICVVPGVSAASLAQLAKQHPGTRFLACGVYKNELAALAVASNVWVELSFLESGNTLSDAIQTFDFRRLVFGSHAPLHCLQGSAKVPDDSDDVPAAALTAVRTGNARQLLG
jgi:predicted TIM-barrel fold metal-dependent hydrolase